MSSENPVLFGRERQQTLKRNTVYVELIFEPQAEDTLDLVFGEGCRITWRRNTGWRLTGTKEEFLQGRCGRMRILSDTGC